MSSLGTPRRHYRRTDSTSTRLRELAQAGAPPGTLVTAAEQSSGRGRQGRTWTAPAGRALLASLLLGSPHDPHSPPNPPHRLLPLAAGVAVAEVCESLGQPAQLKWPNDVLIDGRKVAGLLVEARPQEGWAILGIGLNVAIAPGQLPPELRERATGLGRPPGETEAILARLLVGLERWLQAGEEAILEAVRARDALCGRPVSWIGGQGTAAGIDQEGRLIVETGAGQLALESGEVHLRA